MMLGNRYRMHMIRWRVVFVLSRVEIVNALILPATIPPMTCLNPNNLVSASLVNRIEPQQTGLSESSIRCRAQPRKNERKRQLGVSTAAATKN